MKKKIYSKITKKFRKKFKNKNKKIFLNNKKIGIKLMSNDLFLKEKFESIRQYFVKKFKKKINYSIKKSYKLIYTKKSSKARMGAGKGKIKGFHYPINNKSLFFEYNKIKFPFYSKSNKLIFSKLGKKIKIIKKKI